jgi:hypothetical protein
MKESGSQSPPEPQGKGASAEGSIADDVARPKEPMVLDGWFLPLTSWWPKLRGFLTSGFKQAAQDRPSESNRDTRGDLDRLPHFSRFFKRQDKQTTIVVCPLCGRRNRLRKDAHCEHKAACGACGSPLSNPLDDDKETKQNDNFERDSPVLYRMVAPGRFQPVGKPPFIFPPVWLYRVIAPGKSGRRSAAFAKRIPPRKTVIALAAAGFIMTGLFPPWFETLDARGSGDDQAHARIDRGYSFIFSPPSPPKELWQFATIKIDGPRLLIQWSCIAVAGAAAWFLCGAPNPKDEKREP